MGFFSEMQFGFQEGLGCTETSFNIIETINHILEHSSKVFIFFLDVRKAFETVWIHRLLYKLFSELGIKCDVVTFGETIPHHFESLKNREWLQGDTKVEELCKYKNIGVLKYYIGSFSWNIHNNIDETRKKVGVLFISSFDCQKVNPLIFVNFWRQDCLPMLLYGAELFINTYSYFTVRTEALPVLVSQKYFLHSYVCTCASTRTSVVSKLS